MITQKSHDTVQREIRTVEILHHYSSYSWYLSIVGIVCDILHNAWNKYTKELQKSRRRPLITKRTLMIITEVKMTKSHIFPQHKT